MDLRILSQTIERDTDIIAARHRTRTIAEQIGFDDQDRTRITTAVSEIVRNALEHGGGGRIEFWLKGAAPAQSLAIAVKDNGPGIAELPAVLAGRKSATGLGVGLIGARRLMDEFTVTSTPGAGTHVELAKLLPARVQPLDRDRLAALAASLNAGAVPDAVAEVRHQNRELITQFNELQKRQDDLAQVNEELQDTNRGVVALYAELEDRADHLRRADQLKSRFLSNMSHEFRTPLNSILSLSRLLLMRTDGELSIEQEKQIQFIRKAAENLTDLVNDLLDLAKVEAGKIVVHPGGFAVADLFGALRGMLRPLLVGDAVSLVFEENSDSFPTLMSDEGKISQILRNFISNALKFTERGEIRVTAEYDLASDSVLFRVRDTGIGIAPKDIDLIWEEFSQVQHRIQTRVKGTGLGLPLSKKIAGILGGSVGVDSVPGEGSTFWLALPRVYGGGSIETEGPPAQVEIDSGRIPVLVIEDNAAEAFGVERMLAASRYQAISVRTIDQAKRMIDIVRPGAILLDVLLEGEESWSLLLELKQRPDTHDIPVIVVSAMNEDTRSRHFGAQDYLDKPLDPARLLHALDDATGAESTLNILLVDDEEVSRYLVRQLLPRGGFQLTEAETPQKGLDAIGSGTFDVLLVDFNLGPMDGIGFLDAAAQRLMPMPPVIVITAAVLDPAQRARLELRGRVISKFDLTTEMLVNAIRAAAAPATTQPPGAP